MVNIPVKKKKILIFGGAGFLGRALAKSINLSKNSIYIVDTKKRIKIFRSELGSYEVLPWDISKPIRIKKLSVRFDRVYYFAALASGYLCEKNSNVFIKSNIMGTINIVKWAEKNKPKEIIFSSSMTIYGENKKNAKENDIIDPISNYGIGKYFSERKLLTLKKLKIKIIILRFFNLYGPGQDFSNENQGMFSIYLNQILNKKDVIVKGSLDRFRDFIYIDDAIRACKLKFNTKESIFNVGSGKATSVRKLLNKLLYISKTKKKIIVFANQKNDTFGTFANIKKIKKLKWKPQVDLDLGIKKTLKFLKN